jgi:putative transposase
MDEKYERALRRKAIGLTLRGVRRQEILQRLGRGHTGLHKWQRRFARFGWDGLKSHPRRPRHLTGRYDARTRRLVVQARLRLRKRKVGLIGPKAIRQELQTAHLLRRLPSLSTIRRILHDAGLLKPPRPAVEGYFPQPTPTAHYVLQAMDWTGRYLAGGAKVFAFHTIDLATRGIQQTISGDKAGPTVRQHALQTWQTLGLPDGLQMDNDAAFCGGYKVPRVFGDFVRLCLYVGIEPLFLPVHEPKRNGVIEQLNGLWSQSFWHRRRFHSVAQVKRTSPDFTAWYGHRYQPPALRGLSPAQAQKHAPRVRLTARDIRVLPGALPITAGRVHFLRGVDAEGKIRVLNETWRVDKRLAGHYVWATLVPHQHRLKIYHRRSQQDRVRLVKVFHYQIPERVAPLLPQFKRRARRRKMSAMC